MTTATTQTKTQAVDAGWSKFCGEIAAFGVSEPGVRLPDSHVGCEDTRPDDYGESPRLPQGSSDGEAAVAARGRPEHILVDLHGFPTWQAIEEAETAIIRAWEDGCRSVTLIHGAPDVRHWTHVRILNRGSIKWALRGRLSQGEWNGYVFGRRSSRHRIEDGSMTLAIRPKSPD